MTWWDILSLLFLAIAILLALHMVVDSKNGISKGNQQRRELAMIVIGLTLAAAIFFRDTIRHPQTSIAGDPMKGWQSLGLLFLAISVVTYVWIYSKSRALLQRLNVKDLVSDLISRVPKDDSPAWPHILAGVCLCLGTCFLLGSSIASLLSKSQNVSNHGIALTSGGLVFAALISGISFWTLCQTKRIELIQGSNIDGFRGLIQALTEEMKFVNSDFIRYKRACVNHRIYLVTTNPYFGFLSFGRDDHVTEDFETELRKGARHVESTRHLCHAEQFKVEILCGAEDNIKQFHEKFYGSREISSASRDPNQGEDVQAVIQADEIGAGNHSNESDQSEEQRINHNRKIDCATEKTEEFILDLNHQAKKEICFRAKNVPTTQFAIIGNVVFEFILDTPGLQTEIHKARVIREKIVCDRFVQTFGMLRRLGKLDV